MTFPEFLRQLRTWDPGHLEPQQFPEWEFVQRVARSLEKHDRLLVVKSRQMMISWIGCAFIFHRAITAGPGVHLVISKEERSAKSMIERVRFLIEYASGDLDLPKYKASRSEIVFPTLDSKIVSLPAAEHAVRGQSPRTLFWDEMAFTPNDEQIWAAVKPAVDSGGCFFGVSTPNGPLGVFYRLIQDRAFEVARVHYTENPLRSSEWEEEARVGLSDARWRREQELSFEGAEGRVYDQFDRRVHVLDKPHTPGRGTGSRLYRAIDFGYRRPAVLWVEEASNGTLTVFAELLGDRWSLHLLQQRILEVDARYGLTEHDFAWTAVDPAGDATSDFGISPADTLRSAGFHLESRKSSISPGVEMVRSLLMDAAGNVKLYIDPRCTRLLNAFDGYQWDKSGETPQKDGEHDHLMDALRYLVISLPRFRPVNDSPPPMIRGMPG